MPHDGWHDEEDITEADVHLFIPIFEKLLKGIFLYKPVVSNLFKVNILGKATKTIFQGQYKVIVPLYLQSFYLDVKL